MAPRKKTKEVVEAQDVGDKAVKAALASLRKKHGEVVNWMSDTPKNSRVIIPTGSLRLDAALGVGGLVLGRMYEFFGPNMSGKSTLALSVVREATKAGHRVIYIDAEHALDDGPDGLLVKMGIDMDKVMLVRGYTAEQNLDIAEALMSTGEFSICVLDSVAALQPAAEANLESFDNNLMGVHPRLMARMCRSFIPLGARTNTALILINQIRANMSGYGSPDTTGGGNAIPHFCSVRIKVTGGGVKSKLIKDSKGDAVGQKTSMEVVKNKLAPPWRTADVDLIFGKGFDRLGELVDLGVEMGFVDQSGAWFSYKGDNIGQGRNNTVSYISENEEVQKEIEAGIYKVLGIDFDSVPEERSE